MLSIEKEVKNCVWCNRNYYNFKMTFEIPEWINQELFEEFIAHLETNGDKINDLSIKPAFSSGENYMSTILEVKFNAQMKGKKQNLIK